MDITATPFDAKETRVKEDTSLRILNSSEGVRNYIPKKDFFDMMLKVFNDAANNLTNHCGPYSRSALIVSPSGGKYETNTFTKDGRNIVNCMNFVSPIEEIIKEMLLYIGSRVDNKAGDGTTSSMYIAARFFSLMAQEYRDKTVNSRQFAEQYKAFQSIISQKLEEQRITIDELMSEIYTTSMDPSEYKEKYQEMVAIIAAFQTLSSSGGDVELARCMYEIYEKSPRGTWDYVITKDQKYENTQKYSVENDPSDYIVDADLLTPGILNHNLYSEYQDKVDILVLPQEVPDDGILADEVSEFINTLGDLDRPLMMLARSFGATILRKIQVYNNSHDVKIAAYQVHDRFSVTAVSMDLIGLGLCGGVDPYMVNKTQGHLTKDYIIKMVDVHYKNHQFHVIDNLWGVFLGEKDLHDSGTLGHPFYKDEKIFPPYIYFIKSVQNRIGALSDDINQTQYHNEIESLQTLLGKMTQPHRPYLLIGGASHDHAEAKDVVRDCCGAINSSLTDGFICGSSLALLRAICIAITERKHQNVSDDLTNMLKMTLITVCELIDITLHGCMLTNLKEDDTFEKILGKLASSYYAFNQKEKFINHFSNITKEYKYLYINILDDHELSEEEQLNNIFNTFTIRELTDAITNCKQDILNVLKNITEHNTYPILQPSDVFEQLFTRIGELMIKLITTECIVVPGAVYIKDNN